MNGKHLWYTLRMLQAHLWGRKVGAVEVWFKKKATMITLVSHRLCRRPCFPEELAVTSVPCLRAVSFPANQTASPSADPAASSGNSGSLSGHGCYCKLEWKTQSVRGPLLWPCDQEQSCVPSSQSRGRRGVCLPETFQTTLKCLLNDN